MESPPSLTRVPAVVEAVEWESKTVRTGGPSGLLHEEWEVSIALHCATSEVHKMTFVDTAGRRRYVRDWARERGHEMHVRTSFRPYDWDHSDRVDLDVSGAVAAYHSNTLKTDPAATVVVHLDAGDELTTGTPVPVLTLPGLTAGLLLVCQEDTQTAQSRWRVRAPLPGSLEGFDFLTQGRRSGIVALNN